MQIRAMDVKDLSKVLEIEQSLFPSDAWTKQLFLAELAEVPMSRSVVVVEDSDEIIGYASLRFIGKDGDINTIAISTPNQNQGYGKLLLNWLLNIAKEKGVKELFLDVRADNDSAIAMYKKSGFEQIDVRKNYYDHKVDALVMRKKL